MLTWLVRLVEAKSWYCEAVGAMPVVTLAEASDLFQSLLTDCLLPEVTRFQTSCFLRVTAPSVAS